MILLNPGPVNLSARVRRALEGPDLCHREEEFAALQEKLRDQLLGVYELAAGDWSAVLLTGSGTAAVEAMLTSLVPRSGHLLVLENGVYGERMTRIARAHGLRHRALQLGWPAAIELGGVDQALGAARDITHLAVVHHETTTGRLNPLGALAELCSSRGVDLLVDAVSSFGAEAIDFASDALVACAATANKCLHGAPGAAFVVARRSALATGCDPPRSVYLDLAAHGRDQDARSTAFTPGIPAFYALREALSELSEAGGWSERRSRYRALSQRIRAGLDAQGYRTYLDPRESSVVLQSYLLPDGMTYDQLHDELKKRGFVIYSGQGALREELFRISPMGAITDRDVAALLTAFADIRSR